MDQFSIQIKKSQELNEEIKEVLDSFSAKLDGNSLQNSDNSNVIQLHDPLDLFAASLITIIVEYFNETSELPPPSILLEHYVENISIPDLEQILLDEMNPRLVKWGLPTYNLKKIKTANLKNDPKFDPLFILACQKVCDQSSSKSFAARIKELKPLGISEQTWTGWMNIPSYFQYAQKLVKKQLETVSEINANNSLAHLIQKEDLSAIKYYNELTGRFRPQLSENNQNLQFMIITLLEILVKHVDPSIIDTIATELEDTPVGQLLKEN